MGVPGGKSGIEADLLKKSRNSRCARVALGEAMYLKWLGQDVTDPHPSIKRSVWILENHLEAPSLLTKPPTGQAKQVDAIELD
jgi:hypothetical protein